MKKIVAIALILYSSALLGSLGCMDSSYHLARKNDPKQEHYISCNCPCEKRMTLTASGTCFSCGHTHAPRSWMLLSNGKQPIHLAQYRSVTTTSEHALSPEVRQAISMLMSKKKSANPSVTR